MPNFSGIWTVTQQMQAVGQTIWPATPGAPTIGTATATGATTATVAFTAPAYAGYPATITGYTATSSPGGITGTGASSPISMTGLSTGTAYTFTVTATNATGTGPASAASNSITLTTVPDAPTIGTATATGSSTATVSYTAPAYNGGLTITSYTATSSPGGRTGTLSQAGSGTITVTGLTANTAYTFTVRATNPNGQSAPSAASNSATPFLPAVGEAYEGGYFIGQISTSASGVANFNLVISPKSSGQTSAQWKTSNTGGDPASVINGPANTAAMNSATYPAAQFCENLTTGGYSDWYMPAIYELASVYYYLKPTTTANNTSQTTGGSPYGVPPIPTATSGNPAQTTADGTPPTTSFRVGNAQANDATYYWSSSEQASNLAYSIYFATGRLSTVYTTQKTNTHNVRAIRRVAA